MSVEVSPATLRGEVAGEGGPLLPPSYHLVRKLGAGGMAEVHLAIVRDPSGFERRVAIKFVRQDYSSYPELGALLTEEARLAERLRHQNIVSVLDFDVDPRGLPYLVMEYVSGVDLSVALRWADPLPISVAVFIAAEVLRGLAYAHDPPAEIGLMGLVHRDISPQNILLSWEGAVKIGDFGISRALLRSSVSGGAVGKPGYMSPEHVRGDRLDRRSDLFAVGVVLWEMLTGQRLFHRGSTKEILGRITAGNFPLPSELRPEIPRDLEHVVMKLLEVELPHRYGCADEALADLDRCACLAHDGAAELRSILRERFHQPARGSDEVSAMREVPREFDWNGVTSTNLTITAELHPNHGKKAPRIGADLSGATPSQVAAESDAPTLAVAVALPPAISKTGKRRAAVTLGVVVAIAVAGTIAFREGAAGESRSPRLRVSSPPALDTGLLEAPQLAPTPPHGGPLPSASPTAARAPSPQRASSSQQRATRKKARTAPRLSARSSAQDPEAPPSGMVLIDLGIESPGSRPSGKE